MNPTTQTEHLPLVPTKKKPSSLFMASNPTTPSSSPSSSSSSSHYSPSITNMDHDHLLYILSLLPPDSILSFSMTCRKFRSLASEDTLWESICRREWGPGLVEAVRSSFSPQERSALNWKRLYREVSQLGSLSCWRLSSKDGTFPQPRASHSLNLVSDCLVLFGGGCEGGRHLDDTWVAYIGSGISRILSWQQVSSGSPSGRFGHSCTVVGDTLILFGGINDNGVRHNDTWVGHVVHGGGSLEIKILWRPLDVGSIAPPARGAHAACCAGERRLVIHGGIGLYGLRLNDTWLLDLSDGLGSGRWYQITSSRASPPARSGHSLTWIDGGRMVLFGGRGSGYEVLNDVWLFDSEGEYPEWMELKCDPTSVPGEMPLPRVGHSASLMLGGHLLIYGGEDSQRHRKDDFWVLDVGALLRLKAIGTRESSRRMWKELRVEGQCPEYRSFHGACTDRSRRHVYVFGGMVDGAAHPAEAYGLRFDAGLYLLELVLRF